MKQPQIMQNATLPMCAKTQPSQKQHSSVDAETATFFICVLNSLATETAMAKLSLHGMPKHGQTKFNTKHWPQHGILQSWQLVHSSLHQNIAMVNLMLFSAHQDTATANLMLSTACQNSHENLTCFPGCRNTALGGLTLFSTGPNTTPSLAAETQQQHD